MKFPKIYLVLDNCFAIKRWVKPSEWLEIARDIGFNYVQASTDNEIDPLFSPKEYMDDWALEVKKYEKITGVKVINFYTGYQTYRTAGLAHHDERIRRKLMEEWLKPLIRYASDLKSAGIGFSYFALPDEVLQDPLKYKSRTDTIINLLGELSEYAYENGEVQVSFEQMYAPHQPPWTIEGTLKYLKDVYDINKKPAYTTIDVGHMVGQNRFLKPSIQDIENSIKYAKKDKPEIWLGSDSAYEKWSRACRDCTNIEDIKKAAKNIYEEINNYPYLFSEKRDSDIFKWVEELSCYSPIIHMQQTNGISSSHAAFTPENNKNGVVTGERLLSAIEKSYLKQSENPILPAVDNIYLSFEIFASNVESKRDIIKKLKQTLTYWRKYIPRDGILLDKLLK